MRFVDGWRKHEPGGLTNRSIGMRQSGLAHIAYLQEHPKARGLRYTQKGTLNKRYHQVKSTWRGRNPITGKAV